MKKIQLTQGKFAIVDDEDFLELSKYKWYLSGNGYATRTSRHIRMHRVINSTPEGFDTDHINGDKLDNRRSNLRTATRSQNNFNTSPPKDNTSGTKGVWFSKRHSRWYAQIKVRGVRYNLGSSISKEVAVRLRINGEKKLCV